ncbi:MAG: ABC transporter permease [Vicinamibacterales bacterium]
MRKDLVFTFRALRRQPAFTAAAIGTLAVGLAAAIAIFSTVNAALLQPLPYPHAGDIRVLGTAMTDGRPTTGRVAAVEFGRLLDPALSIDQVSMVTAPFDATLLDDAGRPTPASVAAAGEGFFELFALPMSLGRPFTHEETVGAQNAPPVAILSYAIWQSMFGGDPGVLGGTLRAPEIIEPVRIVGVAPQEFDVPHGVQIWINLRVDLRASASGSTPASQGHNFVGYVRLKPGTSDERLASELKAVMSGIERDIPLVGRSRIYTAHTLVDALVGDLRPMLLLILAASAVVLVLACINVINLLLARGAVRSREIALRVALGATRGRVVRQLLTEAFVLAAGGAAAGLALAYVAVKLLIRFGVSGLPRLDAIPFDATVLLFVCGIVVAVSLFVGSVPALRFSTANVRSVMGDGGRAMTVGRSQHRLLAGLVVLEIALAIVLVAGAGVLLRSFDNQRRVDPGFASDGRLEVDLVVPFARYNAPEKIQVWTRAVEERLRAIGGVSAVGSSALFPLNPRRSGANVTYLAFAEQLDDPDHPRPAHAIPASRDFFQAMGIRLIAGRSFSADDRRGGPLVAVVNRSFVRRYLDGRDPLTTRFAFGYPVIDAKTMTQIVGVVDDVKYGSLREEVEPVFYTPEEQTPYWRKAIVVSTALRDPSIIQSQVRAAIAAVDAQMAVQMEPVSAIVSASLAGQRLGMVLMLAFAAAALVLAAIGIYGVIAYSSAQRVGEVATRMALGATPVHVFWMMMRQGGRMSALGVAGGLAGAYAVGRIVASQLYEVRPTDPATLAGSVGLVSIFTAAAVLIPAWRSARVSPARVLRLE